MRCWKPSRNSGLWEDVGAGVLARASGTDIIDRTREDARAYILFTPARARTRAPTFRTRWRSRTRGDASRLHSELGAAPARARTRRAYIPNSVALPHARGRDAPTFYSLPHARGRDAPTSLPIAMDTRRPPELALDGRGSESRTRLWLRYLLPVEARGQRIRAARPGRSGPMHD